MSNEAFEGEPFCTWDACQPSWLLGQTHQHSKAILAICKSLREALPREMQAEAATGYMISVSQEQIKCHGPVVIQDSPRRGSRLAAALMWRWSGLPYFAGRKDPATSK